MQEAQRLCSFLELRDVAGFMRRRQTERQADRKIGRQADRWTDRETDIWTDRLTGRQTDEKTVRQTDIQMYRQTTDRQADNGQAGRRMDRQANR